jgi:hypothetical protein
MITLLIMSIASYLIIFCMRSDVDEAWYPREKVGFAGRKLHGDNCVHIMRYIVLALCYTYDLLSLRIYLYSFCIRPDGQRDQNQIK